jgi:hypothetical protein
MAKLADAADLKSAALRGAYGFESRSGHHRRDSDRCTTLTGHARYVFPSLLTGERCMSENTARGALRGIGYSNDEMTPHGLGNGAIAASTERPEVRQAVFTPSNRAAPCPRSATSDRPGRPVPASLLNGAAVGSVSATPSP